MPYAHYKMPYSASNSESCAHKARHKTAHLMRTRPGIRLTPKQKPYATNLSVQNQRKTPMQPYADFFVDRFFPIRDSSIFADFWDRFLSGGETYSTTTPLTPTPLPPSISIDDTPARRVALRTLGKPTQNHAKPYTLLAQFWVFPGGAAPPQTSPQKGPKGQGPCPKIIKNR